MEVNKVLPRKLASSLAGIALVLSFLIAYEAYRTASAMAGIVWLVYPFWASIAIGVGFATGWLVGTGILYVKIRRAEISASDAPINKPGVYISVLILSVAIISAVWSAYEMHVKKQVYSSMTSSQKLDDLSRNPLVMYSPHLEESLSRNPSTGSDTLARLYESDDTQVRRNVCEHSTVTAEILAQCATESDPFVLGGVAKNPKTPIDVVNRLSHHASYSVRSTVGFRTDIGPEIIDRFSRDESPEVRGSILFHPQLSGEVLERLANDPEWKVRARVAANKKTPLPVLLKLTRDPEYFVRLQVLRNDAPEEVVEALVSDPHEAVQVRAKALKSRKK